MMSSLGRHADVPLLVAAGFAVVLLLHAIAAPVPVGPGLDLTQPPAVVGNVLATGGAVNCDTVGNCLAP
jgi:hypothetical protein